MSRLNFILIDFFEENLIKICRTCGAPMDDESIFCPMCGAKNENINYSNEETTVLKDGNNPINSAYYSQQT